MFRWVFGLVLASAVLVSGVAPETASASPGKNKPGSSQVAKGKKGKKGKKGHKKGGHHKKGHKKSAKAAA